MEAKDVTAIEWVNVKDWSDLDANYENKYGIGFVCELDVDQFVAKVFREMACKLDIPYGELKPILKKENKAFYDLKDRIFREYGAYRMDGVQLVNLEKLLIVPDLSKVDELVEKETLDKCLKLYNKLSNMDKLIFLNKIGKVDIKVETYFQ